MPRRPKELNGAPNPIDELVGQKVKSRRITLGLSQHELAQACDVSFQQVQKYERGTNRVSASRLYQMSEVLGVPIEYFFDGVKRGKNTSFKGFSDQKQELLDPDLMTRRDTLELVRAFASIDDPETKKQLLSMAKTLSGTKRKRGPNKKKKKA